jgi:hypothetical protein
VKGKKSWQNSNKRPPSAKLSVSVKEELYRLNNYGMISSNDEDHCA